MAFVALWVNGSGRAGGLPGLLLLFLLLWPVQWAAAAPAARAQDEVYVYDVFHKEADCGTALACLKQLPLDQTDILYQCQ